MEYTVLEKEITSKDIRKTAVLIEGASKEFVIIVGVAKTTLKAIKADSKALYLNKNEHIKLVES